MICKHMCHSSCTLLLSILSLCRTYTFFYRQFICIDIFEPVLQFSDRCNIIYHNLEMCWNFCTCFAVHHVGSIPTSTSSLLALTNLKLYNNMLTGELWQSSKYDANMFHAGSIPSSISRLTALKILNLDNNKLTGEMCHNDRASWVILNYCVHIINLAGSIPPSLISISALTYLRLYNNKLTGSICYAKVI